MHFYTLVLDYFFFNGTHIISPMNIQVCAVSAQNESSVQKRCSLPHLLYLSQDIKYCWTHDELPLVRC